MKIFVNLIKTLIFLTSIVNGNSEHFISGKIVDEKNNPLIGANIIFKGTSIGSTTDYDGKYIVDNIVPGKYDLLISYIGYKSKEFQFYISRSGDKSSDQNINSDFSLKLGVLDTSESGEGKLPKAPFFKNLNFTLELDALETEQIVVSASKKQEKVIDAPITIAVVSNRQIRKTAGSDLGSILKTVRGVETYQAGMARTAINVRGFMSAFNGRFVSLVDGANYMEPTFYIAYGNTLPFVNEDIERLEVVFGPSSALYGPNAHNGLLNIITKHPRDSEGSTISFGSGSSNYQSFRVRHAKAVGSFAYKVAVENTNVLDWEYSRIFGQDYNMDGQITDIENHEKVLFWDWLDEGIAGWWDDKDNDGQWDYLERLQVMDSEIERKMTNTKANLQLFYEFSNNSELSVGHEHYFQSGYQPFDSGLNFIDYTMGSLWSKLTRKNFFARIHWLRSTGTEYWNSESAYLNMMRRDLTLRESIDKVKISDFLKTDVYKGDFQNLFKINDIDFIFGGDFSLYRPKSNRQFLDDKGIISESESNVLAGNITGENIEINEFGSYLQASLSIPFNSKLITAIRYDKHSYYEARLSPRYAFQYNGLKGGNIRFSYNRAFQTPSIFNLHLFKVFNNEDGSNVLPFLFDNGTYQNSVININNPYYQTMINDGKLFYNDLNFLPMKTQFLGNKNGFTINENYKIPGLDIETVDSYEFGLKKLFSGNIFLDASFFYSKYRNFISPLRVIHDFYPSNEPYIPEQITHIGNNFISDYVSRSTSVIYSYTSTSDVAIFGSDLMVKYNLGPELIFSLGYSLYSSPNFNDSDQESILKHDETINLENIYNDTLRYFINNSLKSFSYQQGNLYFNAPRNKGFISFSKDNLFDKNLWVQLTANFSEEFDFVSGYHVATKDKNIFSLSPNSIYENRGPIAGGIVVDIHIQYVFNNRLKTKLQLNNLFDQDGPRVVGTPPTRRNGIIELILNY